MAKQTIDKAVLITTVFLNDDNEDVKLKVNLLPKDELFGLMIRLNGRKLFPENQGISNKIPKNPIDLGNKRNLSGKELIIDSYIIDDEGDFSDDTFIEVELLGLESEYKKTLHQTAVPDGSMVIYRIEIKFY